MYNGLSYEVECQAQRSVKSFSKVEMKQFYGYTNNQRNFAYSLVVNLVNAAKTMHSQTQPTNQPQARPALGAK